MQLRQIPVACIQARAHDRDDFAAAWTRVRALVDEAGGAGAKLIVLPEGTVPAYVLGEAPVDATTIEVALRDLGGLARAYGATLVCGCAKIHDAKTYNAAIVIGPDGAELGHAAKQFLWHFDRRWYAAGDTLEPIDTPVGRLGVLVCADGRIPTIAATLRERGAELLVMPTAWVTSGRDPANLENIQADLMAGVRARENGLPFVVANKVGFERASVAYCGKSAIVDATGAFVARGSQRAQEIVFGTVALGNTSAATEDGDRRTRRAEDLAAGFEKRPRRVAFTMATDRSDVDALAHRAAQADADVVLSPERFGALGRDGVHDFDGFRCALVADRTIRDPRGLVAARLAGIDAFAWLVSEAAPGDWDVRFARTRAAELRAYVIVFDGAAERAYVVDPDGVVIAGTFEGLRLAAFVYDPARCAATTVAPTTDVLAGLRTAERIRAKHAETADRAR